MNPQQPENQQTVTPPTQTEAVIPVGRLENIKSLFRDFWQKIRKNKKIFWLLVVLFSIMFLIIVAGTIYKIATGGKPKTTPSPTPTPQITAPPKEEVKEPLDLARDELKEIDKQLIDFDINQKRLLPPSVDFDIEF